MTTTLQILSFLSFAAAVCCYSIKELQAHGKLKWSKDYNGFWGQDSSNRKYKKDWSKDPLGYDVFKAPNTWYYRFFKIKYKERFPLSATLLVSLTDGSHLMQTALKLLFCISIVTYSIPFSWWMVLIYFVEWGLVFTITYKCLSK